MESRTQGSRPRTQKNLRPRPRTALPRTNPLGSKDQGHKRKGSQKKILQKFFSGDLKKKVFKNFFQAILKKRSSKHFFIRSPVKTPSKIFFFRRPTKFQQFKKKCYPRAEDRAIFEDLRPRGQGQGLDLRGQGLQNLTSMSRTSSRTPPLVLTTCFHKEMVVVLGGVLVACNSLKTMTTDKLYQRIDYYFMLICTQTLIWPSSRPQYSLNFSSEKIGPHTISSSTFIFD